MEWEIVRVDDVFDVINGFAFCSNDLMTDPQDNCWEVLKIGHISPNGGLRTQPKREYAIKTKKNSRYILQKGDIVMGMTDMKSNVRILGVPAIVDRSNHYALNQRVGCLRIKDTSLADNIFCYYQMGHSRFISDLRKTANSGVQVNLTTIGIRSTQLFLPPLSIQRRIASILSAYDNLIGNNNRRIRLLEQMAENLYKEWFVRFRFPNYQNTPIENGIPKGWRKGQLGEIVNFFNGFAFKSETFVDCAPYKVVTIKNVQDGKFDGINVDYIEEVPKRMPQYCNLLQGDILLSLTGNVGRVCIVLGSNYLLNQRVAKLTSDHPHFTYCLFRTDTIFNTLNSIAYGTAQLNLSPIKAARLKMLIPPVELRNLFDKQVASLFTEIATLQTQSANLTRQRDLLLPRLMSGQLPTQ